MNIKKAALNQAKDTFGPASCISHEPTKLFRDHARQQGTTQHPPLNLVF